MSYKIVLSIYEPGNLKPTVYVQELPIKDVIDPTPPEDLCGPITQSPGHILKDAAIQLAKRCGIHKLYPRWGTRKENVEWEESNLKGRALDFAREERGDPTSVDILQIEKDKLAEAWNGNIKAIDPKSDCANCSELDTYQYPGNNLTEQDLVALTFNVDNGYPKVTAYGCKHERISFTEFSWKSSRIEFCIYSKEEQHESV